MAFTIRKVVDESASKFVKVTTLRGYPTLMIHTARTGERPGYKGVGTDDYIVGDFIGFDSKGKVAFQEYGALWSIKRNANGEAGAMFRDLGTPGVVVGHIEVIELKNGNTMNVFRDDSDEFMSTHAKSFEEGMALLEKHGTQESAPVPSQTAPAAPAARPW